MDRVLISATDRNLEHFAVNMFKSFRFFDNDTPMMCIVRDVSKKVEAELKSIGVRLARYSYPKSPANMVNVSVSVANYLPRNINPAVMWMDIDALFVDDVSHLWTAADDYQLTALPGMNDEGWITRQKKNGNRWAALGMYVARASFLKSLWIKYAGYETGAKCQDEGVFIRENIGDIRFNQLSGPEYYCGRELVESLKYDPVSGSLVYPDGVTDNCTGPRCIQFNIKLNGKRPRSDAVEQWISDHL